MYKSEVKCIFEEFKNLVVKPTVKKIKALRIESAQECVNKDFSKVLKKNQA